VRCSGVWEFLISQLAAARFATITTALFPPENATGWRRPIGCLKLQEVFATEPLIIGLFCREWPVKIRHLAAMYYIYYSHCCNVKYVLQPLLQCTKYMHSVCNDNSHCWNVCCSHCTQYTYIIAEMYIKKTIAIAAMYVKSPHIYCWIRAM